MSHGSWVTIAALFATSCLVRIIPAFVTLRLRPDLQRCLQEELPVAVFINFAVYIAYGEIGREPWAAAGSLLIVGVIALGGSLGLIATAAIGTAVYAALLQLPG
ncbi:hypothetical protein C5U62_04905 [Pseudomonas protegens]|uniref:AzlD domain-containing protein n=1 Tax=Pseudomonas protegens TaxID=380021 RepID=A0A2T6GT32_9PSED|nr:MULTISPECIES: hypothetical protein [Pseudomonas]PUA47318.1 hypothetical protein C5U62_04905 [Pseudomonas protegens]ULT73747.1 hypothetical protein L1O02_15620 [Pseudomonas sp. BC42]